MEVRTSDAEEVNDFTTEDNTFNIPTVTRPITIVLHS